MTKRKAYFLLTAMNFIIYGLNGIYYSFIQQYLSSCQPPIAAGYLLSVGPAVTMISPFFWGIKADKAKYKNTVMLITVIGGALSLCTLPLSGDGFVPMLLTLVTIMFFIAPFSSLVDAITLEYAGDNGMKFGFMRWIGTLSFGAVTLGVSVLYDIDKYWFLYSYAILALLGAIVLILSPRVRGHAEKHRHLSLRPIFRDRRLMGYTAMIGMSQFVWAYYLNAYPSYITETLSMPQ